VPGEVVATALLEATTPVDTGPCAA